jgi:hypothetical protein
MSAIYGLYAGPESAQRAFESLADSTRSGREAVAELGIRESDIVVISSEPFEEYGFGQRDHRTPMPWIAALGGLLGGLSGFELTAFTQKAYPLPTGGMPIVSLWPNAIITYEMTMLGAVLATLITLLVAARLPRWSRKGSIYDSRVSDGKILVGVANAPERSRRELERRLREAGAEDVVSTS